RWEVEVERVPRGAVAGKWLTMPLAYAGRGWLVFPVHSIRGGWCTCGRASCDNVAKHPRTEHGVLNASVDAQTIRVWWSRWPGANVAIATGAPSKLLVL